MKNKLRKAALIGFVLGSSSLVHNYNSFMRAENELKSYVSNTPSAQVVIKTDQLERKINEFGENIIHLEKACVDEVDSIGFVNSFDEKGILILS